MINRIRKKIIVKKICLILISISLLLINYKASDSVKEGKHYIKLNQPIHNVPELLEFFSFYCTHCYQFEQIYNISNNVQKKLPKNITLCKYHINYLGGDLGKQLTHAWAVAIALGVENKLSPILFTAIQKQQSIHTVEDIRTIFIQSGIKAEIYDEAWNSTLVKNIIHNQEQAAINFKLTGVPAIFINGKYMIKNDQLDISSVHTYIQQLSELLNLLIEKT